MYLSRLVLDTRSRQVLHDLGDCQDLHRTLLRAFPQAPDGAGGREHAGLLFRLEPDQTPPVVLAQSRLAPDWSLLPGRYLREGGAAVKVFAALDGLAAGMHLRFRVRANPTHAAPPPGTEGQFGRGKRRSLLFGPAVSGDGLTGEQRCLAWLARKGAESGFDLAAVPGNAAVPDVRVAIEDRLRGWRRDPHEDGARRQLTLSTVLFEGRLLVRDAAALREAVAHGIGPGKAYGCGLLSLARL